MAYVALLLAWLLWVRLMTGRLSDMLETDESRSDVIGSAIAYVFSITLGPLLALFIDLATAMLLVRKKWKSFEK